MTRDIEELEKGLLTEVGPRGVKLSGGQVQRSAAARMFARNADLLVMDDLSSALDVETERALWEGLFRRSDVTCLAVSHQEGSVDARPTYRGDEGWAGRSGGDAGGSAEE